ncbi:MAG: SMP-30/gluconolactonase/LRE family protein [Candidatus Binataceae bacterium]
MGNRSRYSDQGGIRVAAGWTLSRLTPPSTLFGANGMRFGPDGRLYVAQAFGSQVSAVDIGSGAVSTVSPIGGEIVAPDDLAFDSRGVLYATEVMSARVCARSPNGALRIIADQVPGANGITAYQERLFMDECRPDGRLFELFIDGRAPRLLAENLPLPNALAVGPDGNIYFPAIGANEIWRVPLSGGRPERFTNQVAIPTAVKFNSKGELLSTQGRSGEILRFDLQSGNCTVAATMRAGIDNFVLTGDDRMFVSHFVDGGVAEIMADGRERVLVAQGFLGPLDIEIAGDGRLYAADGISMAVVERDGASRRVGMLFDGHFPGFVRGLAAASYGALVTTTSAGAVVTYHPVTHEMTEHAADLQELYGVAVAPSGAIVVAEGGAGRVLQIDRAEVSVLARGLDRPTGIASGGDGSCYVCEAGAGRVVEVNDGVNPVLGGLREPQGLLRVGDELFVIDAGAHELIVFSLRSRQREIVASNLPVGAPPGVTPKTLMGIAGLLPGPLRPFAGLTRAPDGTIYVAADGDGSVLSVRRA